MIELADLTETLELLPAEERLIEGRSGIWCTEWGMLGGKE